MLQVGCGCVNGGGGALLLLAIGAAGCAHIDREEALAATSHDVMSDAEIATVGRAARGDRHRRRGRGDRGPRGVRVADRSAGLRAPCRRARAREDLRTGPTLDLVWLHCGRATRGCAARRVCIARCSKTACSWRLAAFREDPGAVQGSRGPRQQGHGRGTRAMTPHHLCRHVCTIGRAPNSTMECRLKETLLRTSASSVVVRRFPRRRLSDDRASDLLAAEVDAFSPKRSPTRPQQPLF